MEWGGIGNIGGFVESRTHHGAAGVTSRWAARLEVGYNVLYQETDYFFR